LNKSKSSPHHQEEGKEGGRRLTLRNDVATSHSYDISMCQIAEVTRAKVISRARTVPTAEYMHVYRTCIVWLYSTCTAVYEWKKRQEKKYYVLR